MAERKLRMAVPSKGWLIHPERWNVGSILKLAGIGEYHFKGKEVYFESFDSEIEVIPIRTADIPYFLYAGVLSVGVTTKDLVKEFKKHKSLKEICDLECSYVDLVFARRRRKDNPACQLDERKDNWQQFLDSVDSDSICITRYPNIAHSLLNKLKFRPMIFGVRGAAEKYLINGIGDFILEALATGDSLREFDLEVLKKIQDSSARLYVSPFVRGDRYKIKKIEEIKSKIENVMRDIDNCCQVRIELEDFSPKYCNFNLELGLFSRLDLNSLSLHYDANIDYNNFIEDESDRSNRKFPCKWIINRIINKAELPKLQSFLEGGFMHKGFGFEDSIDKFISFKNAVGFDLKQLYKYCPLLGVQKEEKDGIQHIVYNPYAEYLILGDYPCCDSTKLRDEHYSQTVLFSIGD